MEKVWITGVLRDFGQFAGLASDEAHEAITLEHLTMIRVQPDDQGQATAIFIPYPLVKADFVQPAYEVRKDDILLRSDCAPVMEAKLCTIWGLSSPIVRATILPPVPGGNASPN